MSGVGLPTRRWVRAVLVVLGYVAAWYAGEVAVWLKNLGVSDADRRSMSGMFAAGDAITFLAVASVVAIFPTILLARFVGTAPRFWRVYSLGSLWLSSTALPAGLVWLLPAGDYLGALRGIAVLRVLASPLFFLAAAPGLVPAAGPYRKHSLLACAFELCAMGCFAIRVVVSRI